MGKMGRIFGRQLRTLAVFYCARGVNLILSVAALLTDTSGHVTALSLRSVVYCARYSLTQTICSCLCRLVDVINPISRCLIILPLRGPANNIFTSVIFVPRTMDFPHHVFVNHKCCPSDWDEVQSYQHVSRWLPCCTIYSRQWVFHIRLICKYMH
jgi:hypothetical protein